MTPFPTTIKTDGDVFDCMFDMTDDMPALTQCETMTRDQAVEMLGMVQVAEMEEQAAEQWDNGGRREYEHQLRQDRWEEQQDYADYRYHAQMEG